MNVGNAVFLCAPAPEITQNALRPQLEGHLPINSLLSLLFGHQQVIISDFPVHINNVDN